MEMHFMIIDMKIYLEMQRIRIDNIPKIKV